METVKSFYDYYLPPGYQCKSFDQHSLSPDEDKSGLAPVYYSKEAGEYKYCEFPVQVYNMPGWPGWEEMKNPSGKGFYVDHITGTTHWKSPKDQGLTPVFFRTYE